MANAAILETKLNDIFVKNAPALPKGGKKVLVEWAPWLALLGGILTLWSVAMLWHWAHVANDLINYANSLSAAYGGTKVADTRMTVGIWLGLLVLLVEGVIYLLAFPGLRDRKKSGWNWIYYGALINIVYGFVIMFTNYGGVGSFLLSLVGSVIGLWLLFQVRASYLSRGKSATHEESNAA
jgi:uncharacterized membrane protein HdeD (DUF308 family)